MNISRIVHALLEIGNSDDFDSHFLRILDVNASCGPTRDQARRDYNAMMKSKVGL